jgi:hypothetical protein
VPDECQGKVRAARGERPAEKRLRASRAHPLQWRSRPCGDRPFGLSATKGDAGMHDAVAGAQRASPFQRRITGGFHA